MSRAGGVGVVAALTLWGQAVCAAVLTVGWYWFGYLLTLIVLRHSRVRARMLFQSKQVNKGVRK